jgi:hypothetical protein
VVGGAGWLLGLMARGGPPTCSYCFLISGGRPGRDKCLFLTRQSCF